MRPWLRPRYRVDTLLVETRPDDASGDGERQADSGADEDHGPASPGLPTGVFRASFLKAVPAGACRLIYDAIPAAIPARLHISILQPVCGMSLPQISQAKNRLLKQRK
jgi:hypothetical protein